MQIFLICYMILIFISSNAYEIPFLFKQVAFLYPNDAVAMHSKLMGYYNFAQAFFIVIAGYLSDKYGKKALLYTCFAILTFAILLQAFAYNIETLLIARVLIAVRAAGIVIIFALASEFPKESRMKVMGFISATFAISYIIFPYISGLIVKDIANLKVISTALFLNGGITLTGFLAANAFKVSKNNISKDLPTATELKDIASLIWVPILLLAIASFLMSDIETLMPPTVYELSKNGKDIAMMFGILSLTIAITEIVSALLLKASKINIVVGFIIIAVGFLFYSYATSLSLVIASMIIISIGFGLVYPSAQAMISILTPQNKQGLAFSIAHLLRVGGAAIANFTMIHAYDKTTNSASLVWFISAIIALVVALYLIFLLKMQN